MSPHTGSVIAMCSVDAGGGYLSNSSTRSVLSLHISPLIVYRTLISLQIPHLRLYGLIQMPRAQLQMNLTGSTLILRTPSVNKSWQEFINAERGEKVYKVRWRNTVRGRMNVDCFFFHLPPPCETCRIRVFCSVGYRLLVRLLHVPVW